MEGESCFFESDRFLIINDVELLYWHWAGLGERRFDVPGGDLKGCVTLEDGTPMLITSESILLFDGFDWVLSPLSVILDGEVLNDTTHLWRSDAGDTFFFAFESGLSYWESGTIYDIDIPSLATQNASLRVGTIAIDGVEKGDGVWVASEDWVYALSPQGTSFDAYVLHGGGAIEEMAAYGAHHFAMVIDGDIHVHDGDERIVYRLPSAVTHVWGHPGRSDLLAGSSKPEWWIRPDGNLIQLTNLSSAGTWYLDTQGVMISERSDGLTRHHLVPFVRWRGIEPGDTLQDNAYISLTYGGWGLMSSLTVTHNDNPVGLDMDNGLMLQLAGTDSENWILDDEQTPLNNPQQLFDGEHALHAEVVFEDDALVEASVAFRVGDWRTPTWVEDVEVIYNERCVQCHYDGSATFPLHRYGDWVDDFETIYLALESGQMPMPLGSNDDVLSPLQLEMLSRWQSAGFPETPDDIVVIEPEWSWNEHIQPLFQAHCVNCHGPQGGGRSLDEREEWQAEIDNIINSLETGMMPLSADPLSEEAIAQIRAWKEAGFSP